MELLTTNQLIELTTNQLIELSTPPSNESYSNGKLIDAGLAKQMVNIALTELWVNHLTKSQEVGLTEKQVSKAIDVMKEAIDKLANQA